MLPECDNSDYNKEHDDYKWNVFKKKLPYFTYEYKYQIDEIRFIAKQANVSTIGISQSNLD